MAGGSRKNRLEEMAAAPAEPAPDLLGAEDAPHIERRQPLLVHKDGMPCPVVPLGVLGKQLIFLDRQQQIVMEAPRGCSKGEMKLWFGNEWLIGAFPQWPKGAKRDGPAPTFDQDDAQTALVEDCSAKGIFNPQGKVLGRGAHRPRADESLLVLHMGRAVMIARPDGQKPHREPAGMVRIGGKDVFFPADDNLPAPAEKPAEKAAGEELLQLFGKWRWGEPSAPLLLLGWVAQAFICGALEWRAHVWLPGPTASGKSSLQKIIRAILDDWCLSTADASEAAIRQMLGNDALAVSIDEAEAHDNPERLQAVLNLMKKGSSGDRILRGSADHKAQEFNARSCFLLSSVLHAPLRGEDRNRIALLEMRKLPDDVDPLDMELAKWRSIGRRLHRRMIEQWPRFERTLAAYKREIGAMRYEGRWQDTYGALLACADLLLYDKAPDEDWDPKNPDEDPGASRVAGAARSIMPLLAKSRVEARTDTERVLQHLTSHILPGAHGMPGEPVGVWIDRAMTPVKGEFETDPMGPNEAARAKLRSHGMKVVRIVDKADGHGGRKPGLEEALLEEPGWTDGYLAVAYATNKAMCEIFNRSEWAGGGWLQSLKKVEGAQSPFKVRFAGQGADNALLVPLLAFRGDEG